MNFDRNKLFCRLDNLTPNQRNAKRFHLLKEMELLENNLIPLFDEATQIVTKFLEIPICILGVMIGDEFQIKSAIGLSEMGLMNDIVTTRKISRQDTFSTYVIDSHSNLIVENTLIDSFFSQTKLTQHYRICAYLGTPLITSEGECIGTLEVMNTIPHQFSDKDINFLEITARWCLAEYQRNKLLIKTKPNFHPTQLDGVLESNKSIDLDEIILEKNDILVKNITEIIDNLTGVLIQQLSNPLTLIIGMASVLKGEIYGHLTAKQKEYIEIIYNSGQNINSLMDKIVDLDNFDNKTNLEFSSFDLESLVKQIINSLEFLAKKQENTLSLSLEPSNRIWILDKQKIRETIYYILVTILEGSHPGGEVKIHISHRQNTINFRFWVTHSWLGEGIFAENIEIYAQIVSLFNQNKSDYSQLIINENLAFQTIVKSTKLNLYGLLFSCYLAQLQGGKIIFKGSSELGYRFILAIPLLQE